ncbi:hypothetical protein LINGRAHAP2_LOCUS897 [Linum grandiflorum]
MVMHLKRKASEFNEMLGDPRSELLGMRRKTRSSERLKRKNPTSIATVQAPLSLSTPPTMEMLDETLDARSKRRIHRRRGSSSAILSLSQAPPPPSKRTKPTTADDYEDTPDPDYMSFLTGLGLGFPLSTDVIHAGDNNPEPANLYAKAFSGGGSLRNRHVLPILVEDDESSDEDLKEFVEEDPARLHVNNMADDNVLDGQSVEDMLVDSVESEEEAIGGYDTAFAVSEEATDGCNDLNDAISLNDDQTSDNVDPLYSMFLENVTEHEGAGYMLKLSLGNDLLPITCLYEEDDNPSRCHSLPMSNGEVDRPPEQACDENPGDCRTDEVDVRCPPRVPDENMESSVAARKFFNKRDNIQGLGLSEKIYRMGKQKETAHMREAQPIGGLQRNSRDKYIRKQTVVGTENECRTEKFPKMHGLGVSEKICRMGKQKETAVAAETPHMTEARATGGRQRNSRDKYIRNIIIVGTENERRTEKVPIGMSVKQETADEWTKVVMEPSQVRERRRETHTYSNGQALKTCKDVRQTQDGRRNYPVTGPVGQLKADKCYETFLSSLTITEMHLEFKPAVGENVVYEDYISISSDSDVEEIDAATFATNTGTPFVTSKPCEIIDVDAEPEGPSLNVYSEFRAKLITILSKPYNQEEHDHLLKEVYAKNQKTIEKQFRDGRSKMVKVEGEFDRSYIELYQDFATVLEGLKPNVESNRPKTLNLLRGFFCWLENIPFPKGVFKPWLDESSLKVLPCCKLGDGN